MIEALTTLSDEAATDGGDVYCALYEFQDPEVIAELAKLKSKAHVILSNMPGTANGQRTNDTYAPERKEIHDAGADVIDRFMPSGHIGHNKFQVLDKDGPQAVLFGSTNWTSHALCAQTNNSIIARSPALATAYKDYWERLKADTDPPGVNGKAQQSADFREANAKDFGEANAKPNSPIPLEDGSGTVDLWFSPNTPKARSKNHGANEPRPPDLAEVFDLVAKAQQAILFLVFQPGSPSVIDAIAGALKAKPSLFVRGAVTASQASGAFYTAIHGGGANGKPKKHQKGDPPLPEDYRVIHAQGITASDAFGQWEGTEPSRSRDHPRQDHRDRSVFGQLRRCDRQPQRGLPSVLQQRREHGDHPRPSCGRRGLRRALPGRLRSLRLALLAQHRAGQGVALPRLRRQLAGRVLFCGQSS